MATVAQVRAQVAARLGLLESAPGVPLLVLQSSEPPEFIKGATHSPIHLEYTAGTPREEYTARNTSCRTDLEIVIAYHLQGMDRIDGATGYDAMLAVHAAVITGLQTSAWGTQLPKLAALVDFVGSRSAGLDGWVWLSVTCTALHPL